MPTPNHGAMACRHPVAAAALASVLAMTLAACGGGAGSGTDAPPPATTLAGTVAVGAPISDGTLRVYDADGALVAERVLDVDGRYSGITLSGPAPYRLEACGHAGDRYRCLTSVAYAPGTANVTPLTDAALQLAGGTAEADVAAAQATLRGSLAGVLGDAGLDGSFDLITGDLSAGARTGYDRVLDAVGVATGTDARPFVQITPRYGQGNVYIERGGAALGSVTLDANAATLDLSGLDALFARMSAAMADAGACASGMAAQMASGAHMNGEGGQRVEGAANVAAMLCGFFAGEDGGDAMWGSQLMSPTLGRCSFAADVPTCRVSFTLRAPDGAVMSVGGGMGVTQQGGAWKFLGDVDAVGIRASARAQRDRRLDGDAPVDTYARALAFDIPALPGLACARIVQATTGGATPVAIFKRHPDSEPERLSLWTADGMGTTRSLDPASGSTRSTDDTWIHLPDGSEGDTVVRNFYRAGRTVQVSLYGDAGCSTPLAVGGQSVFEVDVDGVPPVAAALPGLPWPEPTGATVTALGALTLADGATADFNAAWTFPHGVLGIGEASFCAERACASDGPARLADQRVVPGATATTLSLHNQRGSAVTANGFKMLTLHGSTGEGVGLQANFFSCPGAAAGPWCP